MLTAAGLTPAQITALNAAATAGRAGGGGRGATLPAADVTSLLRVDNIVTPQFTGDETFFEALFAAGPVKFADVRAKAEKGEPIAPMSLPVRVSVAIDNTFDVVSEQISHNVVGMIPGTDPVLKDTYVMYGSHLDHVGYSQTGGGAQPTPASCRARSAVAVDAVEAAGKKAQNPRSLSTAARAGGAGRWSRAGGAPAAGRGTTPPPPVPFEQRDTSATAPMTTVRVRWR